MRNLETEVATRKSLLHRMSGIIDIRRFVDVPVVLGYGVEND